MVGGGNYIEYQNLVDYANSSSSSLSKSSSVNLVAAANSSASKRIIYGCSTVVNANQVCKSFL